MPIETESALRLALLVSGSGTTMDAIICSCTEDGRLYGKVNPVAVIADRECRGVEIARRHNVPVTVVKRGDFPSGREGRAQFGEALLNVLQKFAPDVVTQNGWLSLTPRNVIDAYAGRIFNQHPAPLDPGHIDVTGEPLHFGGKGIFGLAAHACVLEFQRLSHRKFSTEATIHRVTDDFDRGSVVMRRTVVVYEHDSPEELSRRVLPEEHDMHIEFLKSFYFGTVQELFRINHLIQDDEGHYLYDAKMVARSAYHQR